MLSKPLVVPQIEARLDAPVKSAMSGMEVHAELDSTNAELLRRAAQQSGPLLCLAEQQTRGRGRLGRSWYSPPGANLYWSLLWRFPQAPAELLGLSALTAIGAAQALHQLDATDVKLKWPNDLLWDGRKLAGILLESNSTPSAPTSIVAGIGLNIDMPADNPIDQAWIDLRQALGQTPSRNAIAAALLNAIVPLYQQAAQGQWPDLLTEWARFDAYQDQTVQLRSPQQTLHGIARGIDKSGALIFETDQGIQTFTSGEVSLIRTV